MRRFLMICTCLVGFVLLFIACSDISLFSKVQVKGAPSIYASLAGKKIAVEEFLTAEELAKLFGKDSKFKVYNYTGAGEAMTFLMYYPVLDMPLNFDEYLGQLDMSNLGSTIPEMEFKIPKFDGSLESQVVSVGENIPSGGALTEEKARLLNAAISSKPITIQERKVTLAADGLVSATLKQGNKITLTLTPTVKGITVSTVDISVTLPGNNDKVKFEEGVGGSSYTANLGGKEIKPGEISIGGSITVSSSVTAGTQIPPEGIGVKVDISMDLNHGFDTVTMKVPEGTKLDTTVDTPLPEEMTKLVSSITFNSVGAAVSLENGLPTGNNITVAVSSTALKITDKAENFPAGATETRKFLGNNVTLTPNSTPKIDMTMKVQLPGHTGDNTFTLKDVKPGEAYSIGGTVAFEVDWKEATINTGDKPFEGSYPADGETPIDLSKIWDKIPEGISLKDVGAYLYFDAPMDNFTLKGTMSVNGKEILDPNSQNESLKKGTLPRAPSSGDWTSPLDPNKASLNFSSTLSDIMNKRESNLSIKYSLSAEEVTVKSEEIQKNQGNQSLSVVLVMTLPLNLEVDSAKATDSEAPKENPFGKKGIFVDLFKLANIYSTEPDGNKDLFKRSGPWTVGDEISGLLDQVKEMKLEITYTNNLGMELGGWLYDSKTGISKSFTISPGSKTAKITLNSSDVDSIMNTYPFSPSVYVFIPDTTGGQSFMLKRDGDLDISLAVAAVTDINYTYDLRGGK